MSLSSKFFDKHDNCIQASNVVLAKKLIISRRTLGRFVDALKGEDKMRSVTDVYGKVRLMINPDACWSYDNKAMRFAQNMYYLCSHKEAVEVSKLERSIRGLIDIETGEVFSEFDLVSRTLRQEHKYADVVDSSYRTRNRAAYKSDIMDLQKTNPASAEVKQYYNRSIKCKRIRAAHNYIATTSTIYMTESSASAITTSEQRTKPR